MDRSASHAVFDDKLRLPEMLDELNVRLLLARRDDLPLGWWRHPKMENNFWRLYLNDDTGGILTCNGIDIPLEGQVVYLIPDGLALSSRTVAHFRQFFIHFDVRGIPPIVFNELFPGPVRVPEDSLFVDSLQAVGEQITEQNFRDVPMQYLLKGIVFEAFGRYLRSVSADLIERCWARMATMQDIAPALDYIQSRLSERIRNEDLARLCNWCEDYFIQRFRDIMGMTPLAYIQKQRVAAAAQQLLFTNQSIDAIAEQTGFSDRFYFSRIFTRETGQPPAAYRRAKRTWQQTAPKPL